MDLTTWEQQLRTEDQQYLQRERIEGERLRQQGQLNFGLPTLTTIRKPTNPLALATKRINGEPTLIAPFFVVTVDLANGNITDIKYIPSLQAMIGDDTPQSVNHLTLMLLFTHRNGKRYLSKTLFNTTNRQLYPPQ